MNYADQKQRFDNLSPASQWAFVLANKDRISIDLDNDNTTFTFDDENKEDDCTLFIMKSDIGNRHGLDDLLPLIGIKFEHV